jgi:DNA-binding SARP family transcriptional activator
LKRANRIPEALDALQRAIDYEPTFESAYLQAMKLHDQVNDRMGAIRLYKSYSEMMKKELDLSPAPEVQAFYERMLR